MKRPFIIISCILLFVLYGSTVYGNQDEIRLLYMNDFHGFANSYKPLGLDESAGGIAYLAWLANDLRKEKPTLFLAAGDMIQGSNWANLFHGKSVIELMNEMKFDAMVLGNHEFDFGQEVLKERIIEAIFPCLGANIEGFGSVKPYVLKELKGLKVAIIGIVTDETPILTHPKNVAGLKFLSPAETAKKYVKELRGIADVIIVLSHIGYHADMVLAEKVQGIDVIVGGDSHTKVERPVLIGKTVIVQAWEHAKALGVLDIKLQNGKMTVVNSKLIDIKPAQLKKDDAVASIIDKYNKKIPALLYDVIGETETDLDGANTRKAETNFGNLVADIVRQRSGAQAAIINGGAIRASIQKGGIKVDDIYTALPFDNYILAFKLTGKQIQEVLEHAISSLEEGSGRFPQVSGLAFGYSRSKDKVSKIKDILIAGMPLEPGKLYTIGTNDFLAAGGDGYKVFSEILRESKDYSAMGGTIKGETIVYSDPGNWLRDVVIEHIRSQKKISPKAEGRIIEIK